MTIQTTVHKFEAKKDESFPLIRKWIGPSSSKKIPLIVLFVSTNKGIALSSPHEKPTLEIGDYVPYHDETTWVPCKITLESVN